MRSVTSIFLTMTLSYAFSSTCVAGELSSDSLEGKWLFTHIVMDGSSEMKVNRLVEFQSDGSAVNYDAAGNETSRASFKVEGDRIVYTDDKGIQNWKVISIEDKALHVDHRGAEMFFERN